MKNSVRYAHPTTSEVKEAQLRARIQVVERHVLLGGFTEPGAAGPMIVNTIPMPEKMAPATK